MPTLQSYVSKELSHFVGRGKPEREQYELLVHVIKGGWLTAPPHVPGISGNLSINGLNKISSNEMCNPQMVCFCDIPIQDLHIHTQKYSRFGISFVKDFIAQRGATPVFYLPKSGMVAAHQDPNGELAKHPDSTPIDRGLRLSVPQAVYFDHMIPKLFNHVSPMSEDKIRRTGGQAPGPEFAEAMEIHTFMIFRMLSYFKFFDHNLEDNDPNNYYLEREWRSLDNIQFSINDIARVFFPSEYAKQFRKDVPDFYGQVTFID